MGLIKAALGAAGGTLADTWKEYFYCDAMDSDVLVCRGHKRTSGRSANRRGSDHVITDGSVIAVADGQCMMIVEGGKVSEICAQSGEYTYDSSTQPSVLGGSLGETLQRTFEEIGKRFVFGGEAPKDQRIYYFNTKEIVGNKYGTPTPVPFRVTDRNIGLDVDISIRCNGEYSYRIADPILFYSNVCGNVEDVFGRFELDSMLKTELLTALQPAFAKISDMGVRYSALPGHTFELAEALNEVLTKKWRELRGIVITSVGVNSVSASKEDEDMIKQLQKSAVLRDPTMAAAALAGAQSDAMRMAAGNQAGAMTGFMGMGMAGNAGGMNVQSLFEMGQRQANMRAPQKQSGAQAYAGAPQMQPDAQTYAETPQKQSGAQTYAGTPQMQPDAQAYAGTPQMQPDAQAYAGAPQMQPDAQPYAGASAWTCGCGSVNTGKFCPECGAKRPQEKWVCGCGSVNTGKFCPECGAKRP